MCNDGKWRCPKCEVVAEVKGRAITIYIVGHTWPKHPGCELAQPIDAIDFKKLEKVG